MRTRSAAVGKPCSSVEQTPEILPFWQECVCSSSADALRVWLRRSRAVFFGIFLWLLVFLLWPAAAAAQRLELSVSPVSITFPSADPDINPAVAAAPVIVSVRIRQNQGTSWRLTALANGDLISGSETVDITNVTWAATPAPPFQNGTLSKAVAQQMGAGSGNVNPAQNGSVTFRLANSWTYSAGTYTQTIVFTLSAP